ncbi:MAG: PAS domain S-box protein [Ignavibacteriales bacterium]|nr:PAS domain S-box protein [Ignavibacteriales bacterium]
MLVIQLIYNIALLVTTSIISGFIDTRWSRKVSTGKILQGITFGFIAILAMLNPFVLSPGVIFDGRSIVLSLCALFFGPVAGIISGSMALVTRLLIGGGGALMGVSVIISSVSIGLFVHLSKRDDVYKLKAKNLYLFGIVVHIAMLLLMMLLPVNFVLITFQTIAVSVIVFYPAATVIIGKILIDHQNNINHVNELKESEERFRTLYEDAPIGFYRATPEGKLLLANKALLKMLGFTSIDELNKHFDRAADRPYYQQPQFLEEIGKNNEIKNIETKWMRTDGKTIVMKGHAKAIRDYLGNILYYDGTVEDITEQKKAQDQVRLHAALSEISPLAISVLDLEGNTLYANQKTIELY